MGTGAPFPSGTQAITFPDYRRVPWGDELYPDGHVDGGKRDCVSAGSQSRPRFRTGQNHL